MAHVVIDGIEVELPDSARLNGIQAARKIGVEIPHYCWHAGLSVVASCRMCLVETGTRNAETGQIAMVPKLVPACQTPAKDGTVFVTNSDKVKQSRAQVEESLLIDHPIDCPICDKAGECLLQDYHFEHGQAARRADVKPFTSRRRELGDTVTLFVDRCVMCTRCVRFTREISGDAELLVINRGSREEIDVFPGFPLDNKLSGNVVDLCPVGALGDKDFLYQQRVWFMKRHPGVCTGCSTGCNIFVEENQDTVFRLKPRENPHVNQWWMCDEGRYGYHHVHSEERLLEPLRRMAASERPEGLGATAVSAVPVRGRGNGVGAQARTADTAVSPGGMEAIEWPQVIRELPAALQRSGRLAAVLSPHLTVEEAWLLASFVRGLDPQAMLAVGYVPVEGADETFKNGFTIRAEKCPNRRGVEEIVRHFQGDLATWDDFLTRLDGGEFGGAWISGGYKSAWNDGTTAERFAGLKALVVQDMFASPLMEAADFQLPGGSFAERAGSYVNCADRLQAATWAVRPPAGARVEGSLYWELLGRPGLYDARAALAELAASVPFFAAAEAGPPEHGVSLKAAESVK